MLIAALASTLMEYPGSSLHAALPNSLERRVLVGLAMGLTAVALIYSPWGRRSGAHMNPAITLAFFRLRKVDAADAAFYIAAQFCGGTLGVLLATALLGSAFTAPPVLSIATVPGPSGIGVAFAAEFAVAFVMMLTVLLTSNHASLKRWTGVCCGVLIFAFVVVELPLSGFSMNPARTVASALPSGVWTAAWIYFIAPPLGMQVAIDAYRALTGRRHVLCAKVAHSAESVDCLFRCGHRLAPHPLRATM